MTDCYDELVRKAKDAAVGGGEHAHTLISLGLQGSQDEQIMSMLMLHDSFAAITAQEVLAALFGNALRPAAGVACGGAEVEDKKQGTHRPSTNDRRTLAVSGGRVRAPDASPEVEPWQSQKRVSFTTSTPP